MIFQDEGDAAMPADDQGAGDDVATEEDTEEGGATEEPAGDESEEM